MACSDPALTTCSGRPRLVMMSASYCTQLGSPARNWPRSPVSAVANSAAAAGSATEPQNDFILATVGEELGLIGTVGLLILFLILMYRCVKIAMNAPDIFSMLIATGITSMLGLQILMNYAVATSSMPATGVTLPFISYGGTSISILLGSIGIMLNISKHAVRRQDKNEEE